MKRLFAVILILASATAHAAYVDYGVNNASFTITNDTAVQLPGTDKNSVFSGVVVASTTAGGVLTVFDNTSGNTTNKIAVINLNVTQNPSYSIRVSSGITYSITGNANGVTILYKR